MKAFAFFHSNLSLLNFLGCYYFDVGCAQYSKKLLTTTADFENFVTLRV